VRRRQAGVLRAILCRDRWRKTPWEKRGSWYLLMQISVVLMTLMHPPRPRISKD
jgi:uncharacterized membrane protein YoaT (DUF817 family)